jgi:hypothetical protein
MTKHYHRLLADEILKRRNELFPNGHPCGWERTLKVNQSLEVRSECALNNMKLCVYNGLQRLDVDYFNCPVYLAKLKEWHSELKR